LSFCFVSCQLIFNIYRRVIMAVQVLGWDQPDGVTLGKDTSALASVYGVTPIAQRVGAAQAAVSTTAATSTTPYGFSTSTQADAIVTLVNELRAACVAFGIIKGAA
jgi:hypothetical protein